MEATGLAFSVYKDVYYLAKGIYRLGMSAQHYREENHQLLIKFRSQCLYLRTFKYFFISILREETSEALSEIEELLVTQVNDIISCIGQALARYHDLVHTEDEEYRKQSDFSTRETPTREALLSTNLGDILPPPLLLQPGSSPMALKDQPIFSLRAWKWALFKRSTLQKATDSFREWNNELRILEPMIVRVFFASNDARRAFESAIKSDPHSDQEAFVPHVKISLLIGDAALPTVPADSDLPSVGTLPAEVSPRRRLEEKGYPQSGEEATRAKDALLQLAALLGAAGAHDFHTLPLQSCVDDPCGHQFIFSFGFPDGASDREPVSLQTILSKKLGAPSLSERFHIAQTITRTIAAFHANGWLHKEISSRSILFFFDESGRCMYLRPYLVNFEYSRPDTAETNMTADDDLARNVYRHPDRQGSRPNVRFNKTHDLYSLGVVLLEIGVWQTALSMRNARLKQEGILSSRNVGPMQDIFKTKTKERLGHTMGPAYQKAVEHCLDGAFEAFLHRDSIFALQFQSKVIKNVNPDRVRQVEEERD
ncbi:hypothetical protein CABS01_10599 [Colletotrichum abscissum]|uniref:Protein kinase domain-containing protein n=1 Tax=Colletotrichum abscissum TaxID=1671311 RepID=A0A9Q0AVK3_9PEZI|nr:uncharacterized protein CABS01_10599 [Colletotrichum abscissum]KAI3537141.1 hypothetical protein CABS02_12250 [Colletotrichum abscissum]KAK1498824.1 hypothetical protein CABS01_10599 [Colletotrichum abscissum]